MFEFKTLGDIAQDIEDREKASLMATMGTLHGTLADGLKTFEQRSAEALIQIRADRIEKQAAQETSKAYALARQRGIDSATPALAQTRAAPVVAVGASGGMNWTLNKPRRFQGYGKPLYDSLKAAHAAGQPKPSARDVLDSWKKNPPPDVAEVTDNGLKYYNASGNTKPADLEAIRKTIGRMTNKRPTTGR